MRRVVIIQEYVPQYRYPFFERLIALGLENSIEIQVAAGQPNQKQNRRGDSVDASFIVPIRQREYRIGKRRVVIRNTRPATKSADVIIMEQARRNLDAYRLLLRPWGRKMICLWGHGKDYVMGPSWLSRALLSRLTNASDWFFAYTDGSRDAVVRGGFPAEKVTVVRNSTDTSELQEQLLRVSQEEVLEFRKAHDIKSSTAIFIGGLDESKRLPFLFEAGRRAYDRDRDFRMIVIGSGIERDYVERRAREEPWLNYLGPRFGKEKALAIAASDIISMPGRVGLVAVDSFAAALPIVTTEWPWHGPEFEYLVDGETCKIAGDNEDSYADAMLDLLRDKRRLALMKDSCRKSMEEYSIDGMASRFFSGIKMALACQNGTSQTGMFSRT
ncbi:glycosyltransferase involved in cell wall biosynthesis [Arthrobacter oryzae]|uniref:glycosyltransferase family 4 protein n=1 Tax=Arthrobacter oryzae TaxID=409290 RepID=UPI00277D6282|nr:glycosyltransferase family 4 protein [Arthrobacter oryzae]MDP9986466.1 glycosyltransferase involved in cell wall biosynthesis [Arthrobacter oryzae]